MTDTDSIESEIQQRVTAAMPDAQVSIALDGNRVLIEVVSEHFRDLSRVKRQQAVYSCIDDFIADGRLHAVTIRADVPA